MNTQRILVPILLLLMISSALAGCIDTDNDDRVTEEFDEEYDADEGTILEIINLNGNIEVTTWDGNTVQLHAEKKVKEKYKEELENVEIISDRTNDTLTIEAVFSGNSSNEVSVKMELKVPGNVTLRSLETANGNIEITGTKGNLTMDTTNGNIDAHDIQGYVYAKTSNGNVYIGETRGVGNVSTSNGNVDIKIKELSTDIKISSSNGNVKIRIKGSLDVNLTMATNEGRVAIHDLEINLTRDEEKSKHGTLNNGGHRIDITTSNGNIDIYELE